MYVIEFIETFFRILPWYLYFGIVLMLCGIYFTIIGPSLFKFWLVPRIENRHKVKLQFIGSAYGYPSAVWGIAPIYMTFLVVMSNLGFDRYVQLAINGLGRVDLKVIKEADKTEIYFSFIYMLLLFFAILSAVIVAIYCPPIKH